MKIIGRNAVTEALRSGKTIDRLVAARDQKDAGAQRIINDAKSRGVKIFFYDKAVLDRESDGAKHQGFIAEVTDFKYSELDDVLALARSKNEQPFIFILDGVEDPHNLGSIIRVAECTGRARRYYSPSSRRKRQRNGRQGFRRRRRPRYGRQGR